MAAQQRRRSNGGAAAGDLRGTKAARSSALIPRNEKNTPQGADTAASRLPPWPAASGTTARARATACVHAHTHTTVLLARRWDSRSDEPAGHTHHRGQGWGEGSDSGRGGHCRPYLPSTLPKTAAAPNDASRQKKGTTTLPQFIISSFQNNAKRSTGWRGGAAAAQRVGAPKKRARRGAACSRQGGCFSTSLRGVARAGRPPPGTKFSLQQK